MKFSTKTTQHYPPHLRKVATLPWEIKKYSNFLQIFSRYVTESLKVGTFFETQCS